MLFRSMNAPAESGDGDGERYFVKKWEGDESVW